MIKTRKLSTFFDQIHALVRLHELCQFVSFCFHLIKQDVSKIRHAYPSERNICFQDERNFFEHLFREFSVKASWIEKLLNVTFGNHAILILIKDLKNFLDVPVLDHLLVFAQVCHERLEWYANKCSV